ncbi:MAG: polymer-forming cytoskeletal protein [Phenylobacterium sp.]
MFSKPASKPDSRPANLASDGPANGSAQDPAARNRPRPASLLAQNLVVEGAIQSDSEVQIDGLVKGDVRVEKLTVGETGRIEGQVASELVDVRGRVIGSIQARQVRLFSSAGVEGDITAEQLSIEPGASFEGRSIKRQSAKAPSSATPSAPTPVPVGTLGLAPASAPEATGRTHP